MLFVIWLLFIEIFILYLHLRLGDRKYYMKLKVNDTVKITAGKDKGRQGKIIKTFPQTQQVLVEGLNLYKRHQKATMGRPGGIIPKPRPLPTANVALICPQCHQPTRVGYQIDQPTKTKTRICSKCKKVI